MLAAVLRDQPGPLYVDELTISEPRSDEVLIRVAAAGLCHSDLHYMQGRFPSELPCVLGHESAGIVEAVGEGVTYVAPGDRVVCCVSVFCGECGDCLGGRPYRCRRADRTDRVEGDEPRLMQAGTRVGQFFRLGGFAERMLVHQHAIVKVSPDIPLDRAALLGCGVLTGTGAVFRTAGVEPGSRVAVIGAGGIGLAAVQAARIAGAGSITVVDLDQVKLDLALRFGATNVVNGAVVDDVARAVRGLTGGGVDYSFEAIGLKETAEQAFRMLDQGGTATVIGMLAPSERVEIRGVDLLSERKLQGSNMGSNQFRTDLPRLVDLYLDGRLQIDEMISDRISLTDINEAYAAMQGGGVTRTVVTFDEADIAQTEMSGSNHG